MVAGRQPVELLEKNKPQQQRAKRTYEAILKAAAELLVEVGVERISTNLVAERAGITVPALYRYFPNKYAVLNALGAALMDRQNAVFQAWFEKYLDEGPQLLLDNIYEVLKQTYEVTRRQPGGERDARPHLEVARRRSRSPRPGASGVQRAARRSDAPRRHRARLVR